LRRQSAIIDEFTRQCITIRIGRRLKAVDVVAALTDLFIRRGTQAIFVQSSPGEALIGGIKFPENGPEFVPRPPTPALTKNVLASGELDDRVHHQE
jgi:hypothetical protein